MKELLGDEMTVVDFGAHFYPPAIEEPDVDYGQVSEDEYASKARMSDPDTVLTEMEQSGTDAMVYSNTKYMGHADVAETARANDALFEYIDSYDEFFGLCSIPIGADGESAAEEFERCIKMGFNGGGLHETAVALTDEEMEPVLEVANRTGAPIFVHIQRLPNVEYRLNAVFGRETLQQQSIARAIHSGLFDRYDDLTLVWHHLGGNIAPMLGRMHLHADPGRWPNQESMLPYDEFKRVLETHVRIDTCGYFGYTAPIRIALEEFPASNILFGTDYPWEPRSAEELRRFIGSISSSATREEARQILGANALDVLINQ